MNERNILVVAHAGREATVEAARKVIDELRGAGARPVLPPDESGDLRAVDPHFADVDILGETVQQDELELAIVLGGDLSLIHISEPTRPY